MLLSIDPGNKESAYCLIHKGTLKPIEFGKVDNDEMLRIISALSFTDLAIEMVASYGMSVGESVFETCLWIGRFIQQAYNRRAPITVTKIYRKDEKINLCGSMRAKDSNIRQALIDRFGVVGTKKAPGWFYAFHSDIWSSYAVGITYLDMKERN